MFLLEKLYYTIKDITCAYGIKQRRDGSYNKHDYASPICANNIVINASALEAREGCDVVIVDIPGAYLHTYVDKHVKQIIIMLFKGKLVDIMVMVDLKLYRKYVTYDSKGNAMLCVEMKKALYALLQSALLFCRKLRKYLEAYGFVINTYDPCVANSIIESHQMTMTYQINKFSSYLSSMYGEKLTVKQGNVHDYLGMDLDFS